MAIAVPTVTANTSFTAGSCTITKPTGLAVGDVMVAIINGGYNVGSITTLAGWTSIVNYNGSTLAISIQRKVADASDVSASNFTFTATGFGYVTGGILRTTGIAVGNEVSDTDVLPNTGSTSSPSFTVSVAPVKANSLVIMSMLGINDATAGNTSSYASTPSLTYTELFDVTQDAGSVDPHSACAYGIYSGTTTFTNFTATFSAGADDWIGVLVVLTPITDATGTNTLLSVSPSFFAPTVSAGTTGTNVLLENSIEFPDQSGKVNTPTQWTNEAKETTVWTNEDSA